MILVGELTGGDSQIATGRNRRGRFSRFIVQDRAGIDCQLVTVNSPGSGVVQRPGAQPHLTAVDQPLVKNRGSIDVGDPRVNFTGLQIVQRAGIQRQPVAGAQRTAAGQRVAVGVEGQLFAGGKVAALVQGRRDIQAEVTAARDPPATVRLPQPEVSIAIGNS